MKRIILLLLISISASAHNKTLNIYIWSDYVPDKVINQFEQTTGITVNVSNFDSNETMYAKLKTAPNAGYDLILPSSYYVARMRKEDMLHFIDKDQLPNFKYLNPLLLNKSFDPDNNFSIPYLWGSTGIVVNKKYHQIKNIKNWSDLWQTKYKNQLLMLNDMRETFGISLITLGYSINDQDPVHIKQAYLRLEELMPNIRLFNSDAEQNIYIDEDITLGMGWSGDIFLASQENHNLKFIYPKNGFSIWIDCWAIAKNAPHIANAYKFLNFLMQPKIAAEISAQQGYSTPNLAAIKFLPKKIKQNKIINPNPNILKRGQFQNGVGAARIIYAKYWQLLKLGG
ncbi:MAG: spermidine/putrescine ABC transporter substrate-binding protein [Gammaproteobacteria bacterium]|nr:spermidine/putrescine ABC transporter substrate-binding protein [Gammaproteobacteria bacterium]